MSTDWDVAWTVGYYIVLPFAWLLHWLFSLVTTLLAPVFYVLRVAWNIILIPFHLLWKFETLFYYFGAAALIGVLLGTVMHFFARFLKVTLELDRDDREEAAMEATWREQMEERKAKKQPNLYPYDKPSLELAMPSTGYTGVPQRTKLTPKSPSPMMSTAILEEDDTSSEDYF